MRAASLFRMYSTSAPRMMASGATKLIHINPKTVTVRYVLIWCLDAVNEQNWFPSASHCIHDARAAAMDYQLWITSVRGMYLLNLPT